MWFKVIDNGVLNGLELKGPLILSRNPVEGMEASTKNYVDSILTGSISTETGTLQSLIDQKLDKTGGTLTGNLKFTENVTGVVWERNTDFASIKFYNASDTDTDSRLEFEVGDNGNEYFRWIAKAPLSSGGTVTELLTLRPNDISSGLRYRGNKVWHEGNDGSDSGLDADTLDGKHATAFVEKTGATLTGTFVLTNATLDFSSDPTSKAYIKRSSLGGGQIDIGSDDKVRFMETDDNVEAVVISCNNKTITAPGGFIGNASSATKLATARNINGTPFDGSQDIVTTKWGLSRNFKITGDVTGNVNLDGSTDVTLNVSVPGLASKANTSDVINSVKDYIVHDTRSVDTPTNLGIKGVRFDFKFNTTDGLNDGGAYHAVMTLQQWNDASGGTIHQLGMTDNNNLWIRSASIGGSWGPWQKLFHTGNDGPGSGLDADTLDGKQASEFATASLNNVSASTLLSLLKTVDGSGSGLDADTLDGLNSSQFVRTNSRQALHGTDALRTTTTGQILLYKADGSYESVAIPSLLGGNYWTNSNTTMSSNGNSGWIKFPNGFLVQWGTFSGNFYGIYPITLPVTYTRGYGLFARLSDYDRIKVDRQSNSKIKVIANTGFSEKFNVDWLTIGS